MKYFDTESVYVYTKFGYCKLNLEQFKFDTESVKELKDEIEKQFSHLREI
jgi:hypothetical protein